MGEHTFHNGVEGKLCTSCGEWKPLADYGRVASFAGALRSRCRECTRKKSAEYNRLHPGDSTLSYHRHHTEELAKRKAQRASVREEDAFADEGFRERFFEKVDRKGPDDCWEWTAFRTPDGYGEIGYKGLLVYSHRAAFALSIGPIPEGLLVLHSCDNPPCCNPKHLSVGTNGDNMRDMIAKGRKWDSRGERHPFHKLTLAQVQELRSQVGIRSVPYKVLAEQYGVSKETISGVLNNWTWRDPGFVPLKDRKP